MLRGFVFWCSRGHSDFFDCLQVLPNHDPSVSNTGGTLDQNNNNVENPHSSVSNNNSSNPPIRAIFANRHRMDDKEHMAWTISCNYQRTLHPIYINSINRIEEMRRKQRQYIYNTLNNIRTDTTDPLSTNPVVVQASVPSDANNSTMTSQRNNTGLKVISPAPTAVHISILKIQSKT